MIHTKPKESVFEISWSLWSDLVFHVLSHLPISPKDASRLYRREYVEWSEKSFSDYTKESPRLLKQDAPLIAALYDSSPKAYFLNGFSAFHNSCDDFLKSISLPFAKIKWTTNYLARRAAHLVSQIPENLLEMFRIALWDELRSGYDEIHNREIIPLYKARKTQIFLMLSELSRFITGLDQVQWQISYPLGPYGRLFWIPPATKKIAIGLPSPPVTKSDTQLPLSSWMPMFQGCHEFVLSFVLAKLPRKPTSTRTDSSEYQGHLEPERLALSVDAGLFYKTDLAGHFQCWLSQFYPEQDPAQVSHSLGSGKLLPPEHFIIFDPSDLEEYQLYQQALAASQRAQKVMEIEVLGQKMGFDVAEVLLVAGDIHSQIYARDFMLIDQSDMIISYISELPGGRPALSSGVERELQHAHEVTREVYVIWRPRVTPSPFITETATKVFADTDEALEYFQQKGYIN